jgi:peptide/nickel transport system substrate-binding protein
LLDGDIDLLQSPAYSAIDQIRRTPGLKLAHRTKLQTMFFSLDQGSPELRSSNVKGRNPFEDKRVRQAMAYASIFSRYFGLLWVISSSLPHAGRPRRHRLCVGFGSAGIPRPRKGRALLAEAGYPDGFSVILDCPSDWGDDEIATCKGVADQLGPVGIGAAINWLSTDEINAKRFKDRQSDFSLDGWHMEPDSERALSEWFGQDYRNASGYANPRVDELNEKIKTEMVTYAPDAYLEEAWRIVTEALVYLPIRHGVSVFAMRKELDIPPDPWDVPRFRLARFSAPTGK